MPIIGTRPHWTYDAANRTYSVYGEAYDIQASSQTGVVVTLAKSETITVSQDKLSDAAAFGLLDELVQGIEMKVQRDAFQAAKHKP